MSAVENIQHELPEIAFIRVDLNQVAKLEVGTVITTTALVESSEVKTASNGKAFAAYSLRDRTGVLSAKQWETNTCLEKGHVVKIRATVEEFNGPQLRIDRLRIFEEANDPDEYVAASQFDAEYLRTELFEIFEGLQLSRHGRVVTKFMMQDPVVLEQFLNAPASMMFHHAGRRGLVEHTLSMCWLARKVGAHYQLMYADGIDVDLLVCGVLLHDFAKALDVEWDGAEWVATERGKLLGHIPICIAMLERFGWVESIDDDVILELQHLVASHHGSLEHGSPIVAKTVEAMLLHQIDMIDSRMAMWREATADYEPGEWTNYHRPLRTAVRR